MASSREFVCDDCKVNVFETGDLGDELLCHGCRLIREMKAATGLTEKQERDLREILGCQLAEDDDVLGATK
jgi:hypothetical protein